MGERPERERSPRRAGRCRAVLLDLDDTLVPTSAIDQQAIGAAARLAAERGAGEGAAPEAIAESFKKLLRAEPFPPAGSGASLAEWRTALWARAMGRPAAEAAAVHDHWAQERLRLFVFPEEVRGLLERLKDRYKMAIVTNGHADVQRPKLAACGAAAIFGELAVVSGEQPEAKPHVSIFRTALQLLGAEPSEAIMVGDSLAADIRGGIDAGLLATVWVRGAQPDPDPAGPQPSHTIGTVVELEAVLDELGSR